MNVKQKSFAVVGVVVLGALLAGCAGGPTVPGGGASTGSGGGEKGGSGEAEGVEGSFTLMGETYEVLDGFCVQVPVEDDMWRIVAEFEGGEATFSEPHQASIEFENGDEYWVNQDSSENQIDVSGDGAFGEKEAYVVESSLSGEEYVPFSVEISCT